MLQALYHFEVRLQDRERLVYIELYVAITLESASGGLERLDRAVMVANGLCKECRIELGAIQFRRLLIRGVVLLVVFQSNFPRIGERLDYFLVGLVIAAHLSAIVITG